MAISCKVTGCHKQSVRMKPIKGAFLAASSVCVFRLFSCRKENNSFNVGSGGMTCTNNNGNFLITVISESPPIATIAYGLFARYFVNETPSGISLGGTAISA